MSNTEEEIDINADVQIPVIALLCMQQMNNNAWATGNALIDSYRHSLARERARNILITKRIQDLFDKPYMPNPLTILDALWPSEHAVEKLATKLEQDL